MIEVSKPHWKRILDELNEDPNIESYYSKKGHIKVNERAKKKLLELFNTNKIIENVRFEYLGKPEQVFHPAEGAAMSYFEKNGFKCKKLNEFLKSYDCNRFPELCKIWKREKGAPDLVVYNGNDFFLVEVKSRTDGLKMDQIGWIKNHPHILVVVLYVNTGIIRKREDKFKTYTESHNRELERIRAERAKAPS